jgi:hypothetical protein
MNTLKTAMAIGIAVATCITATAQAAGINQREAAQRHSIRKGVEDGSLTRPEAYRLGKSQLRMERKEQRFRSDGELTRRERANLQATADRNRVKIYRQRHDGQVRQTPE